MTSLIITNACRGRFILCTINVTGSAKTSHVRTKTEIHFIAQDYSYTQEVPMHSVSTAQCEWVYFSGGHFADPVMSWLREWYLQSAPIGWPCPGTTAIAS